MEKKIYEFVDKWLNQPAVRALAADEDMADDLRNLIAEAVTENTRELEKRHTQDIRTLERECRDEVTMAYANGRYDGQVE